MKSAVSIVFPDAHHRLCSWHLLRNATVRVGRPGFLRKFHLCLMGDLEVDEFETIWTDNVADHELEDHLWIVEMYAKKHSWSNAHIRGKFFAGLKMTSRCEALNMQLEKFIHNGYNLREFVEHFQHYLEFMRRRELVADYKFAYGEPVVKTKLEAIEQFAATVYTREVFKLFREVLMLASNVRVVSTKRTSACVLFEVAMYCKQRSWAVSWAEEDDEFSCSCQWMESFGLPCVHMVGVLVYLNMTTIPKGLILDRWAKRTKQPRAPCDKTRVGEIPDAAYMSMHAAMLDDCRELVSLSCWFFEDYVDVKTRQGTKDAVEELLPLEESFAVFTGVDCVERVDTILASVNNRVCGRTSTVSRLARLTKAWRQERGVTSTTNLSERAVLFLLAVTHRVELD
ncbi:hypothetical protein Ahy_B09g095663 isoform E [Arachis hypogaea]|uniref:Protein FAR1-RELATED SEQUENCE n=1 Tax=Arachis hypogaea TaxID=3818 RepID=A0A444XFM2_ARAHY|nr:hypothetical protein Ahy_B09g095663 isoform E [Arachis hypogaea]